MDAPSRPSSRGTDGTAPRGVLAWCLPMAAALLVGCGSVGPTETPPSRSAATDAPFRHRLRNRSGFQTGFFLLSAVNLSRMMRTIRGGVGVSQGIMFIAAALPVAGQFFLSFWFHPLFFKDRIPFAVVFVYKMLYISN